jgi:CBS domain-containing membrane protein
MPASSFRKWLGVEMIAVSVPERVVSGAGATLAMLVLLAGATWALPSEGALAVVASMGASAVLLFAVPHGPLSQPWPVIAGHTVSALIGVVCARNIPHPWLAAACAVGLAVFAMHQWRCIHPPGGATAFTAVLGGPAIQRLGYDFVLFPVLANAVALVLLAVLINLAFRWRRYPAAWNAPATQKPGTHEEIPDETHARVLQAVRELDSFVDITEEDLIRLSRMLSKHSQS